MLYICVGLRLLAHESRDLSIIETKIIVVTSRANLLFSVKMARFEKIIILNENSCHLFVQLLTRVDFVLA